MGLVGYSPAIIGRWLDYTPQTGVLVNSDPDGWVCLEADGKSSLPGWQRMAAFRWIEAAMGRGASSPDSRLVEVTRSMAKEVTVNPMPVFSSLRANNRRREGFWH